MKRLVNSRIRLWAALAGIVSAGVLALTTVPAKAETFRIAIMQDQKGAAEHFKPLEQYLAQHQVAISLVPTQSYTGAANLFAEGNADGMFSGSGVAGTMILKDLAYPVVRPVNLQGASTYWAVIVVPKGGAPFVPDAAYFKGKRVAYCALASSGEFFFRSIPGALQAAKQVIIAPSHGAALERVAKGEADIAIVKNMVWSGIKGRYPGLVEVGSDPEQNPNGTLIISKKTTPDTVKHLTAALLALQSDTSPKALAAKKALKITGYILTSTNDFGHTIGLLQKAGVDKNFDFHF